MFNTAEYQAFVEKFEEFSNDFCHWLADRRPKERNFVKLQKEYDDLEKQIIEKMGGVGLLNDLLIANGKLTKYDSVDVYHQGMRDCVFLFHWLGLF